METMSSFYKRLNYPKVWLEEGEKYNNNDSYVIYDPSWHDPIPDIPEISLYELFKGSVDQHPDQVALEFLDNELTYGEFSRLIDQFASLLIEMGIKKGDIISPMLPPCPQHWIVFFAAVKIGAISAPLNVMYKEQEISYQINDSGANTVIILDVFYPYFEKLKDQLGIKNIIMTHIQDFASPDFKVYKSLRTYWDHPKTKIEGTIDFLDGIQNRSHAQPNTTISPKQDVVKIIYTSGTTGNSKGAMETHYNIVHNTITHSQILPSSQKPINLAFLPMNHTGGYMVFQLPTLYRGGTVVLRPVFDIEDTYEAIQKHQVNTVFGPPTFYKALLDHPKFSQYDLSSLTLSCAGAAPVTETLMAAWQEKIGQKLSSGWGGTETNSMGTWSMLKNKQKPLSDGVPFIGEMKIVNEKGEVVPRGEVGEIQFRGLQVAKGYFNKPEETQLSFQQDGWFRTGDAGFIDEEDFLHYVDRIKDLIIASGYNIAPVEVEATILQHPSVREVAVIGVPDEYRGETVKAYVVIKDEHKDKVSEQEIIDFCKTKIASFKVPTIVEFINELPRNMMGKILRRVLRDRAKQN